MDEDSLESYYVEGMEIPDEESPVEKIAEGDDESKEEGTPYHFRVDWMV
eukprot:CAMPEP_0185779520 /NCGR_PEP_ID=MMETSP1174-20130828/96069_1 /TAXON_ID=35687 /ORGANISM="Dictyocha speculum, Strain CCMP1381" /LENGTH=48 /DNA_ID= /DNA_START= /DNA_END= /DNA_ORIENTATION=